MACLFPPRLSLCLSVFPLEAGMGGHAADRSETCLARDALGVVARGDREFRGVDGAAPLHLQEGRRIGLDEPTHGILQLACCLIELQPGPGERPQGRKQRPGDVVFRIRAARPQFSVQARSLERPVFGPGPLWGRHQGGSLWRWIRWSWC